MDLSVRILGFEVFGVSAARESRGPGSERLADEWPGFLGSMSAMPVAFTQPDWYEPSGGDDDE